MTEQFTILDPERMTAERALRELSTAADAFIATAGIEYPDNFQGISVPELTRLGGDILRSATMSEVYDYLAARPVDTESVTFYDRLIAEPQHLPSYKAFDQVLRATEKGRINNALDVGSGNGMCAIILTQYADHVIATDISSGLLSQARDHYEQVKAASEVGSLDTCVMNALTPGFAPNSFDVIVSNGFTHYLTYEERGRFLRQVYEHLRVGGRYYQPQWARSDFDTYYGLSPRGRLAQLIAATTLTMRSEQVRFDSDRGYPDGSYDGFDTAVLENPHWGTRSLLRLTKL